MASDNETLDDTKQEDTPNVDENTESKEEAEEKVGEEEVEEKEDTEEKPEDEDAEMVDAEAGKEEEPEEKAEESKEDVVVEASKKSRRAKKADAMKDGPKKKRSESRDKDGAAATPSERPSRERKTVERYSEPLAGRGSASKALSIGKGQGHSLKTFPMLESSFAFVAYKLGFLEVAFKLSKKKPDDNLQILHSILFGKRTKAHSLKKNIGLFSGFVWVENEEKQRAKVKEKLDKCIKEKLLDFCDLLNIQEDLSAKLLEFLESPHATTDTLLADKEKKGKKRKVKTTASGTISSPEAAAETPAKKHKQDFQAVKKRKRSSKVEEDEVEPSESKDDSQENDSDAEPKVESEQEDNQSEEEGEEEEEEEEVKPKMQPSSGKSSLKKNVKKDSGGKNGGNLKSIKKSSPSKPAKTLSKSTKRSSTSASKKGADADVASGSTSKSKVSATKKQKVEKVSEKDESLSAKEKASSKNQPSKSSTKVSSKDQGKGKIVKKAKAEPTKEEMNAVVVNILKQVDFNTATLSDILRQLGTHFGLDLMHRKAEVKAIITDVINNMTDEEDEGEEAGPEDEGEEDENKDNDA
ncbi:hypothetical protein RJ640_014039 [Escallonia rubra]|uniref:DEK-C domain-containing protein n=1 Tax=Escallonia rubra TaxID=112253 RepID=A0AA88RCJ0_9ASTE|nr:hypothetical protein RJ640_014039 [Escallonia rubra]